MTPVEYIRGQAEVLGAPYIRMPLSIVNNPGIAAIQVLITYDHSVLKPVSLTPGPIWGSGLIINDTMPGRIAFSGASAPAMRIGDGDIVIIEFEVLKEPSSGAYPADGVYPVGLEIQVLNTLNSSNNQVHIPVFETDGAAVVSGVMRGDMDGNGQVTAADATELLLFIAELKQPTDRQRIAGKVTPPVFAPFSVRDVTEILMIAAGLKSPPPPF